MDSNQLLSIRFSRHNMQKSTFQIITSNLHYTALNSAIISNLKDAEVFILQAAGLQHKRCNMLVPLKVSWSYIIQGQVSHISV